MAAGSGWSVGWSVTDSGVHWRDWYAGAVGYTVVKACPYRRPTHATEPPPARPLPLPASAPRKPRPQPWRSRDSWKAWALSALVRRPMTTMVQVGAGEGRHQGRPLVHLSSKRPSRARHN
jgi:hypothetical protein